MPIDYVLYMLLNSGWELFKCFCIHLTKEHPCLWFEFMHNRLASTKLATTAMVAATQVEQCWNSTTVIPGAILLVANASSIPDNLESAGVLTTSTMWSIISGMRVNYSFVVFSSVSVHFN